MEKTTKEPIYSEPNIIMGFKMRLWVYLNGINAKEYIYHYIFS